MPQEDAPINNTSYYQYIQSFVNSMQNTVKAAFQRRNAAGAGTAVAPQTQPTPRASSTRLEPHPTSRNLSEYSSPAVPDSAWCSENFMLGAGMVILQPSTHKIVVLREKKDRYWFFPKGRKDIGESLETTAIREGYEESGFKATFFPLHIPTRAPPPPGDRSKAIQKNTEPVFLSLMTWRARRNRPAGEYLTTWYVGQIPEDAEYKAGTGMPDEQNFETYLMTYEQAMERLDYVHRDVLRYVWAVYLYTLDLDQKEEDRKSQQHDQQEPTKGSSQEQPQEQTRRHSYQ